MTMKCLCSNYACFYRCSNHRICFRLLYKVKYLEGTNHLEFNEQKLKSNKMKPVINNESIKEAHENKINYSLRVDHFYQQAEDASPGAFVDSKPIFIKNSTFTIRIYLNGCDKSKKEGKVYVVVMNSSAFRKDLQNKLQIFEFIWPYFCEGWLWES